LQAGGLMSGRHGSLAKLMRMVWLEPLLEAEVSYSEIIEDQLRDPRETSSRSESTRS
jgi:hypothetical protein